jgi:glycine C-acetyltransferase
MLRLLPTASHTMKEVNETIDVFKRIKVNLEAGKYISDEMRSMTM